MMKVTDTEIMAVKFGNKMMKRMIKMAEKRKLIRRGS
jgi:hypothetical protein